MPENANMTKVNWSGDANVDEKSGLVTAQKGGLLSMLGQVADYMDPKVRPGDGQCPGLRQRAGRRDCASITA